MGLINILYFCVLSSIYLACQAELLNPEKIDISLKNALESQNEVDILVSFRQGTESALAKISELDFQSRAEKGTAVYNSLLENAKNSQNNTITTFTSKFPNTKVKSLWISNQIHIKDANITMINDLSSSEDVSSIIKEPIIHVDYGLQSADDRNSISQTNQWGIDKIQADKAWSMVGGNKGEGVVVGIIDTGVRGTHESLRSNYLGAYGWLDAVGTQMSPTDDNGHGTHVTGTIVGQNGIGVAPGAKWSACKALRANGSGIASAFIACAEFFVCPTTPQGTNPDCSKAPKIINNSWGGLTPGVANWFDSIIATWQVFGIIPVFANGNDGPNCNTVGYPAYNPYVIAVGATTSQDELARFSSVGPSLNGLIRPDISAPGENIVSASHDSNTGTVAKSGTSMACPHVAGAIALLYSRNSSLTFAQVKSILEKHVDRPVSQGATCGDTRDSVFPNNHFGYGRLNAYRSLQSLIPGSGNGFSKVLPNVFSCGILVMLSSLISYVLI